MTLKNNIRKMDQRRQTERNFDDSPLRVDIRRSILDLRPLHPEMTDVLFSMWYQKKYGVNAEKVLDVISKGIL